MHLFSYEEVSIKRTSIAIIEELELSKLLIECTQLKNNLFSF